MTSEFLNDYLAIILFLFVSFALSLGFIILNFLLSPKKPDPEKLSNLMAGVTGLEPATSCVTGRRSNQLSYTPTFKWWEVKDSNL